MKKIEEAEADIMKAMDELNTVIELAYGIGGASVNVLIPLDEGAIIMMTEPKETLDITSIVLGIIGKSGVLKHPHAFTTRDGMRSKFFKSIMCPEDCAIADTLRKAVKEDGDNMEMVDLGRQQTPGIAIADAIIGSINELRAEDANYMNLSMDEKLSIVRRKIMDKGVPSFSWIEDKTIKMAINKTEEFYGKQL